MQRSPACSVPNVYVHSASHSVPVSDGFGSRNPLLYFQCQVTETKQKAFSYARFIHVHNTGFFGEFVFLNTTTN